MKTDCLQKPNLNSNEVNFGHNYKNHGKSIRNVLRERSFSDCCQYPQKGRGVVLYKQVKSVNQWIYRKNGLSTSEWRHCLKMTCNVAAVRTLPGRTTKTNRCRHCNELETLGHVLGIVAAMVRYFELNVTMTLGSSWCRYCLIQA